MKSLIEYLYAGVFFLAAGFMFNAFNVLGSSLILFLLGIYFPHRAFMNSIFNDIAEIKMPFKKPKLAKFGLYYSGIVTCFLPLTLFYGMYSYYAAGALLVLLLQSSELISNVRSYIPTKSKKSKKKR
jgi:cation transport ATPase